MNKINIDLYDEIITQIGINSIIDFYRTIAIDERKFSDAIAFVTGIDSPFLNVLFDLRKERQNSLALIETATSFFSLHEVPWGWFITPASAKNDLIQQGFSLLEEAPAMYFNLLESLPHTKSDFITIQEVNDKNDLSIWIQPINEGFQSEEGDDSYRKLNADLMKKGEKKLRHFIAYYKGKIAAASTLFQSHDTVMLHNLATKADFRKCGIGTALTLYMMEQAKMMGFKHCFLDSSEEAFNLYRKIGFKVYCTTLIYEKKLNK
jgi:ribosomal protein S18 acetylase RimI-like enzyme